jgi:hypothetical protein
VDSRGSLLAYYCFKLGIGHTASAPHNVFMRDAGHRLRPSPMLGGEEGGYFVIRGHSWFFLEYKGSDSFLFCLAFYGEI